ncbi:hypothetical protein GCM10018785_69680 [Streptomyces longispororuber]|uniref:SH3 domain-containing protein n=1 Tax=Streptomyces longispororuber TaxID=68230 RepID=A0A919AA07_9ACTN|nr:hypothetical protein [Streptomyces longispororuber]GHE94084.1 hypothetical protein GCM10018785_69680 [Streptomyces longispororuber]
MKKRLFAPAAVAALSLLTTAPTASAAVTAPTGATTVKAAAAGCGGELIKARENIKIRKSPRDNATALRLMYKNTTGCWHKGLTGGRYTKCGGKNWNGWGYITYRGTKGYVPNACVIPAK